MNFEKLGSFYLGKEYDVEAGQVLDQLLMYDARDLTTHAVCVGMTGSGKTGLCIDLLEEAAIDQIPAIIIDPKGDILKQIDERELQISGKLLVEAINLKSRNKLKPIAQSEPLGKYEPFISKNKKKIILKNAYSNFH